MESFETETYVNRYLIDHYDREGYVLNCNGGYFKHGKAYSVEKMAKVALAYHEAFLLEDGRPKVRSLAKKLKVSHVYIYKVAKGLNLTAKIDKFRPPQKVGIPGFYKLTVVDYWMLVQLRKECDSRSLASYRYELYHRTGTLISRSTIHRIFHKAYLYRGGLRKPNLIPLDKFKPSNIQRARDFVQIISNFPLARLKFVDEKLLKNSEGLTRKVRVCPMTKKV